MQIRNSEQLQAAVKAFGTALRNDDGVLIKSMTIDPIFGELLVDYSDSTTANLGKIQGDDGLPGDDGVAVIDVQLVADPEQNNAVFIQTTLSNGIILQSLESLSGHNGTSVSTAYVNNNTIYFELDNGEALPGIPVQGLSAEALESAVVIDGAIVFTLTSGEKLPPVYVDGLAVNNITGAEVEGSDLILIFEDGTRLSAGVAADLKGRDIVSLTKTEGKVYAAYSDAPETPILLGELNGITEVQLVDGALKMLMDDGSEADLGAFMVFTGAFVREGELILTTNQPGEAAEVNVGPVADLKGDKGTGIQSVAMTDNSLVITLTDETVLPPLPVSGLTPISVVSARYDAVETELLIKLSDESEIATGISNDIRGKGIADCTFDPTTGEITLTYTHGEEPLVVGTLPVITNLELMPNGQLMVTWSNSPDAPVELANIKTMVSITTNPETGEVTAAFNDESSEVLGKIRSVTTIETDEITGEVVATFNDASTETLGKIRSVASVATNPANGIVTTTFTDGEEQELGKIRSVEAAEVTGGQLILTYSGGEKVPLGSVIGEKGDNGISIIGAELNESGHLIVYKDDETEIDAGFARTTVQNLIGKTVTVEPEEGQVLFLHAHEGSVVAFRNGVFVPQDDLDLSVSDSISYAKGADLTPADKLTFIIYVAGGPSATGRGVFKIEGVNDTDYLVTLEDGSEFTIQTKTEFDYSTLPPGVASANVSATGELVITLTDGKTISAGQANKAINTKNAKIDGSGNLIITLDDDSAFNAGSVISNLTITNAEVDTNGHLQITLNSGSTFDAGPTGIYVTETNITDQDVLQIKLSDGRTLDAGSVRNPLLGSRKDYTAFEGQTDFPIVHDKFDVMVYANGVCLSKEALDLTNPKMVKMKSPRKENDIIVILLIGAGNSLAVGIQSEEDAPNDSVYSKDYDGVVGWQRLNRMKQGYPNKFVAQEAQTTFSVLHNGLVNVFVNGKLWTEGYTLPTDNRRVVFDTGLTVDDQVMIEVLSAPVSQSGFLAGQFIRIGYESYSPGGTFRANSWEVRQLNTIIEDSVGVQLLNNRLILPQGKYYIDGTAACNGVRQNVLRLRNLTRNEVTVQGGPTFAAPVQGTGVGTPDHMSPISGYFTVDSQSAIILEHRCITTVSSYGFGTGTAGGRGSRINYDQLGIPSRLIDLKIWKVG